MKIAVLITLSCLLTSTAFSKVLSDKEMAPIALNTLMKENPLATDSEGTGQMFVNSILASQMTSVREKQTANLAIVENECESAVNAEGEAIYRCLLSIVSGTRKMSDIGAFSEVVNDSEGAWIIEYTVDQKGALLGEVKFVFAG